MPGRGRTYMTLAESRSFTLPGRIEQAAQRGRAITFVVDGQVDRIPWSQLHDEARAMAGVLQRRGLGPGAHVALLGPTSRQLVTAIQATWLAGATSVVLPLPMRMGSIEEFVAQTRARIKGADCSLVVIDGQLAPFVEPEPDDPPFASFDDLAGGSPDRYDVPAIDAHDLAVLQFTSGSTADPKGVMLPHGTILANLDAASEAARLDPDHDVAVSWLPLYHDMGLIGLLALPLVTGIDLVLGSPQDFMASPGRWLEWMSAFGGTATAGPNFSYALATRAMGRMSGLDLSRWRIALNGAEPVDPTTMDAFVRAAGAFGFEPGAAFPAFGMAELAIAGTFPTPGRGLVVDVVDRAALENERYAAPVDVAGEGTRSLALLGRAVPGLELRVCDPVTGEEMQGREVGELEIRGTSVTPGYYKHPAATAAAFHDGWFRTGDLAYLVDGELVVCGRIKDVIIVGGRNVFPEDVERAAASVEGVRAGNVIAFGIDGPRGRESLVVVAETKSGGAGDDIRRAVSRQVRDSVGLPPRDVVLVLPGTLPKTSSGKLQRSLCKTRYLEAGLQPA